MTTTAESPLRTLLTAASVCLVCSVVVSTSAVLLKPLHEANRERERQRHVLGIVAGHPALAEMFASLESVDVRERVVELQTGSYVDWVVPAEYDPRAAERDPLQSVAIPRERDLAGIQRRAKLAKVYEVTRDERIELLILPVHGKGYASTLHGYLALAADANTVVGLSFYEHAETPGLGGVIDDEEWLAQWRGKKVRDEDDGIRIGVAQGVVDPASSEAFYLVDGISGATRTSDGVSNLIRFWVGEDGFGPFLRRIQP